MLFLDRIGLQGPAPAVDDQSIGPSTAQPERPSTWGEEMTGDGSTLRRGMRAMRYDRSCHVMILHRRWTQTCRETCVSCEPHRPQPVTSSLMVAAH